MFECKVCKISKTRVNDGKRAGCTGFKKVDERGRSWNGRTCPDCKYTQVYAPIVKRSAEFGPSTVLSPPKLRACGTCGVLNPNYYTCQSCITYREWCSPDSYVGCLEEGMYEVHL